MCDVPSIAVFCSESIECFPGIVSKFFLKFLVTIPVVQIMTDKIVHFRFHIRCLLLLLLLTTIGLSPGGSGYFTCKQNMKSVTTKFKSEGLHEKHVVATWNLGNRLAAFAYRHRETKKNMCRDGRSLCISNPRVHLQEDGCI